MDDGLPNAMTVAKHVKSLHICLETKLNKILDVQKLIPQKTFSTIPNVLSLPKK